MLKRSNKRTQDSTFTTRRGLLLSLYSAAFVALISLLVYYAYLLAYAKIVRMIPLAV